MFSGLLSPNYLKTNLCSAQPERKWASYKLPVGCIAFMFGVFFPSGMGAAEVEGEK